MLFDSPYLNGPPCSVLADLKNSQPEFVEVGEARVQCLIQIVYLFEAEYFPTAAEQCEDAIDIEFSYGTES